MATTGCYQISNENPAVTSDMFSTNSSIETKGGYVYTNDIPNDYPANAYAQNNYAPNVDATNTYPTINNNDANGCLCDLSYLRTTAGILKVVQLVLSSLGFLTIIVTNLTSIARASWFAVVAALGFTLTDILLVCHLYRLTERMPTIPWLKIECIFCGLWSILYLIVSNFVVVWANLLVGFIFAAIFGFTAMLVYGFDCYVKFCEWYESNAAETTANYTQQIPNENKNLFDDEP